MDNTCFCLDFLQETIQNADTIYGRREAPIFCDKGEEAKLRKGGGGRGKMSQGRWKTREMGLCHP